MHVFLIILLVLLLVGGLPTWGYHSYGWYPSGLGLILLVILVIVLVRGGGW